MQRFDGRRISTVALTGACALALALLPAGAAAVPQAPPTRLAHHHLRAAAPISVAVLGERPWTDGGVTVTAGMVVQITASGLINFGVAGRHGPAGDPSVVPDETFVAPNLTAYSLMARIGSNPPIQMGVAGHFVARTTGRLALGVNDSFYGNNSGSWIAMVTTASN